MEMVKIFIGYDPDETVAYHTLVQSIMDTSSVPVSITPLSLSHLGFWDRPRDSRQSNDFSYTRFLVPYLCNYMGTAIYMDCDMLVLSDIAELNDLCKTNKAVHVVKHDYVPKDEYKYLGRKQYSYPRKNWSSFIVWDSYNKSNWKLTPDLIKKETGSYLHRFGWLKDDEIGELDPKWNWLVGEYSDPPTDVKNVHWTNGGPYFKDYDTAAFSDEWNKTKQKVNYCKDPTCN
jgi:hypothetical protein